MKSTTQTRQLNKPEMKSTHLCYIFDIAQAVIFHPISIEIFHFSFDR